MQAADFFKTADRKLIEEAILSAESNTSGEIRVHVENSFSGELLDRAATVFARLGMHKTAQRNGVLFYLAISKRQFAILGDAGINQRVPSDFWDLIRARMESHFKENAFAKGLAEGIVMAGEQLKQHFPYQAGDSNELNNTVSFGQ